MASELVSITDMERELLGAFKLDKAELTFDGDPSEADWLRAGKFLAQLEGATPFWIGDWANHGEKKYGDLKKHAASTGLSYSTVAQYKSVCARLCMRVQSLSFQHHVVVASLTGGEQAAWLSKAQKANWSARRLADEVSRLRFRLMATEAGADDGDLAQQALAGGQKPMDDLTMQLLAAVKETKPMQEAMKQIKAVRKTMREIMDQPIGAFIERQHLEALFSNVLQSIKFAMPYGVCGFCGASGDDCDACGGLGWLPKDHWQRMPPELKVQKTVESEDEGDHKCTAEEPVPAGADDPT